MANGIYIGGECVSTDVEALREIPKGNVVTRRFLDGTFQIQTTGEPSFTVAFICHADKKGAAKIMNAYNYGHEIEVEYNGKTYDGLIISEPSFSYEVNEELNDDNKYFSSPIEIGNPYGG